jgi:hypothetical protein
MVLTAGLRAVRERIKLPWLRGDARHAMAAFALCLATACFAPVDSKAADQKESGGPAPLTGGCTGSDVSGRAGLARAGAKAKPMLAATRPTRTTASQA